jgi:ABC-type oligopeptide transport system substrate-binding subunit
LGLPLTAQLVTADTIDFAVFSSQRYDLAVLGWKVSLYPGYLCDWFGSGKPFEYSPGAESSTCSELSQTSDLDQARQKVYEVQASLAQDVPFIPLYSGVVTDELRNLKYPFSEVLGGLSQVYGAPALALPASP